MDSKPITFGTAPTPVADPTVDRKQLEERRTLVRAVKAINGIQLFGQNNELTFRFDRQTKKPILLIVNRETHEVVEQLPPEYALWLADTIKPANFI